METFQLGWAVFTALVWAAAGAWALRGQRSIGFLCEEPFAHSAAVPKVSILMAARNEEFAIEGALRSLLAQHYPSLEIIAVNDRSTDQTGVILAQLSTEFPALRVVSIQELPAGWLGKSHALWCASQLATGDLFLFTDADVVMDLTAVARAVSLFEREQMDHLAVAPQITSSSFWLKALLGGFALNFAFYAWPWKARDPKSSRFIGIGAFNLMRAAAYRRIGTHAAFPLSPIDDMVLGQRLKRAGFRQDMRFGIGLMRVEWYRSVAELVRGLEKNAFAGAEYRMSIVAAGTVAGVLFQVWPFLAVSLARGTEQLLYGLAAVIFVALTMHNNRYHDLSGLFGIFAPFSTLSGLYIAWRSALKALWTGQINWRGTRYPLDALIESHRHG